MHRTMVKARCDSRVRVHAVPNEIGRVKNAPDYDSARCDIRVCAHDVMKCTDYPIKSVGLRMHRTMAVQGAALGFARTPY